jgi:hypothetical protein
LSPTILQKIEISLNLINIPSNVFGAELCMKAYAGQVDSRAKLEEQTSMKIEYHTWNIYL